MGLDISHDAWHGAYSAFNSFRGALVEALGGEWDVDKKNDPTSTSGRWTLPEELDLFSETHPGLWALLCHSDCDGEISPGLCGELADELEAMEAGMREITYGRVGEYTKRIGGQYPLLGRMRCLAMGAREAARLGQSLEFG